MTDSLYSQFESHEAPAYETSKKPFDTPHANRKDLSKPYDTGRKKTVGDYAPDVKPKTGANHELWLWFTRQQTKNIIAMSINMQFNRNMLTGDNYDIEKQRYIETYNMELNK